jgi:hypothetical protein
VYRLCIAHDGPKTADPTLAPLRSAFVPTFREDSQQCAVAGSQFPTFAWIASFCGGVWFPKADLAQLPRGHRPALRPP